MKEIVKMKRQNIIELVLYGLLGIFIIILFAIIVSIPTWLLWNWLIPSIFGLREITLLETLGLLLLSGFLLRSSSSKSK